MCSAKVNLVDLSLAELKDFFSQIKAPSYRAVQLVQAIHQQQILDFASMTNFSKKLREDLAAHAEIKIPEVVSETRSTDGVIKWLLQVPGQNDRMELIEAVYIPERTRGTLCISSQVGCSLNCTFCATGAQGFNKNLSTSEIIGQLWRASERLKQLEEDPSYTEHCKVTNVVMMGMGEPLLNYDAVIKALEFMRSDYAYGLSRRRVTVSTSGVVPKIRELAKDAKVALAISLHAPNDALRTQIMPINKKYPIAELLAACQDYVTATGLARFKITIEYVMLAGVNDSLEIAKQLAKLLRDLPCKINLIPFNPFPKNNYKTSTYEDQIKFRDYLMESGYTTTIRRTRGQDTASACGQLVGNFQDRTKRRERLEQKQIDIKLLANG